MKQEKKRRGERFYGRCGTEGGLKKMTVCRICGGLITPRTECENPCVFMNVQIWYYPYSQEYKQLTYFAMLAG